MESAIGANRLRFKAFELDTHTRELYRNGIRLRVQGQPIDVLEMLLERPGELVTREHLRQKLWPEHTFVDFEHSLNSAVTRLRDALGDRADESKYIETLPRLGYRFVAPVEKNYEETHASAPLVEAVSTAPPEVLRVKPFEGRGRGNPNFDAAPIYPIRARRRLWILLASCCVVFVSACSFLWHASQPLPAVRVSEIVRITSDVRWPGKMVIGADPARVFLRLEGSPPVLGEVPIAGGDIVTTSILVPDLTRFGAVSPDGSSVLVCGKYDPKDNMSELWVSGIMGGPIRYLARAFCTGRLTSWSPNGEEVIFTTAEGGIYTVPSNGGEPHLLRKLNGEAGLFDYSPDGSRIRFSYREDKLRGSWRIWEMSSKGENLHEVLPKWRPNVSIWNGRWTPDGGFFIFLLTESTLRLMVAPIPNQIWAIDERRRFLRRSPRMPVQLTSNRATWSNPIPSTDGRKIFAESYEFRGELVRYDRRSKQIEPYLGGKPAEMLDFSRDGKFIAYSSFPEGVLWRTNRDGSGTQRVAKAPHLYLANPQISPDGSKIVFSDFEVSRGGETSSIYLVSSKGGTPVKVLPDDLQDEFDPTWSPDGSRLAFHSRTYWQTRSVDPKTEVRIVDLATGKITSVPAPPKRSRFPRWSPDGRYIVCLTLPGQFEADDGLEIYDLQSSKWTVILQHRSTAWPTWSGDGSWIYFVSCDPVGGIAFYRIRPSGGRPELIVDLKGVRSTGFFWGWFGFDPDGNPIMLRDAGTDEIYALTLER